MNYPALTEISTTRQTVDVFGGYNHNLRIGDGEMYDMKNLTSSYYPVLSPRQKRGVYKTATENKKYALISKDSLGYIENGEFYLNQYSTNGLGLNPNADIRNTTITSMGAYAVIITRDSGHRILDKKWVNTSVDEGDTVLHFGNIEAHAETPMDDETYEEEYTDEKTGETVTRTKNKYITTFQMCGLDGEEDYSSVYRGDTARELEDGEESYENGEMWLDTSSRPYSLKKWSETQEQWVSIATTYIKISIDGASDCFADFDVYDGVYISGIDNDSLSDINNTTSIIWDKGVNWVKVVGIFDGFYEQYKTSVTFDRKMPDVDFVTESENRLWGCKYGTADNGSGKTVMVNEIYACKLGDFKNWNCFMGLSTDSYAATVGTDGRFTGAVTHLGYPLFFKENCMHKIYGNYPSNYQIQTITCRGVQKDCHKSLAIVNEVLYYKSRNAVCAYDGSLPSEISSAFGETQYSNAVACAHGNKYYISMRDDMDTSDTPYRLFVYDASKGMWHKEDNLRVDEFCSCRGELYYLEEDGTRIKTMLGSGTKDDEPVQWMAETGVIGIYMPDKKYISRLTIKMSLDKDSKVFFYAQYDSMGEWEYLTTTKGTTLCSFTIPVRPKRCDHMRLRIVGCGDAKIYSITKTIEQGSDV